MCYNFANMPKSGLPQAKINLKNTKIGNIQIKTEKPTESVSVMEKSIKSLERVAGGKIFIENANNCI
jgi:hypothetical protein